MKQTEHQQVRIPTGWRQTSWIFTSAAEKLNQGLPGQIHRVARTSLKLGIPRSQRKRLKPLSHTLSEKCRHLSLQYQSFVEIFAKSNESATRKNDFRSECRNVHLTTPLTQGIKAHELCIELSICSKTIKSKQNKDQFSIEVVLTREFINYFRHSLLGSYKYGISFQLTVSNVQGYLHNSK